MRLRISHATSFVYSGVVHASYNEARISPVDTSRQFTLEHRLDVRPGASLYRYRDYWGSRVHAFDIHHDHTELVVTGTSVVETAEGAPTQSDAVGWDTFNSAALADRFPEFVSETGVTATDVAVREVASDLRGASTPAAALHNLGEWIRGCVEYRPGVTSVSTTAAEVLRARHGVCQDFVHLSLAVLRSAGIPARYVSGYLFSEPESDVGTVHQGQSHAWLEAWMGDWRPVDPTSGDAVGERHVVVARGRDYTDVAPFKGVYHGGSSHTLDVSVELTRLA
jgi:transglutaminase-like putative cysteine protease